ncbi:membrane anchoring protein efr3a [Xenoophorus captivus]|uniref:Membrane anchoring protein efr3a n=1 Tax=Xenoophorus captivus TaxID=1517983 RepID=A0ABV0R6R8_9TELE
MKTCSIIGNYLTFLDFQKLTRNANKRCSLHPCESEILWVCFRIRVAGIKGLQGVVRKTVNDELQAIIWEPQHMDKLIPSMLFNMQDAEDLDRERYPSLRDMVSLRS